MIPYHILSSEYDADENKPLCLFMNLFFPNLNYFAHLSPQSLKGPPPTMNNMFMPKMHSVSSQ